MTARSLLRSVAPLTLSAVASVLLAAGCSAPPGADTGDDGVPEFGGLPSGTPGVGAGGTASTGNPPTASAGTTGTGAPPVAAGTGGSTGAPSNEQPGGNNVGLDPNQNNGQNGGQNQGAGGSMMAGAAGNGNVGSAGAPTNPPVQGTAGQATMPPGDNNQQPQNPPEQPQNPPAQNPEQPQTPPQAANCGNAFVCDDFEGVAAGASPNAAVWQVVDRFAIVDQSAKVVVSGENSRSGGQALRVTGEDGRNGIRATVPQASYFVRAFFQIDTVRNGTVFMGLGTDQSAENRFRIQGNTFGVINTTVEDAVRPQTATSGNGCPDCFTVTANEWFCAEMAIDSGARTATLFIDGEEIAVAGPDAFVNQPTPPAVFIGSWGLQGGVSSVWVDDVAIGPQRIGCN